MKIHGRFLRAFAALALFSQFALAQQPIVELRRQTFEIVWGTVKQKHFDPKLNGVDWEAVRRQYAPLVADAGSDDEFYRLLNAMLGELKQSHFAVIPPSFFALDDRDGGKSSRAEVGVTVQMIEGRPTITRVERDSTAFVAGLRPGFIVMSIGAESLDDLHRKIAARKERPVMEQSLLLRATRSRLRGEAGTSVTLRYLDENDAPRTTTLVRKMPDGLVVKFGDLPTPLARIEIGRLEGAIGYLRFNLFLLPMLDQLRQAVKSFHDAPGIILDLRGAPGGEIAVTTALAGLFYTERASLGITRLRQGELYRPVFPDSNAYTGPLVILTDEGTVSAAETFSAAMQENGRAKIVGRPTIGAALPSVIERLPTGARLQYAIGEYRTPKGFILEGRGAQPDASVEITRRDLLAGRDPVIEKGVSMIQAQRQQITAEEILEKNIVAIGGRKAIEKGASYCIKATLEMQGRNVQGELEICGKAPDKLLTVTTINKVGVIKQGFDGKTGWSHDPYQGLRTLEGDELEKIKHQAIFNPQLKWRELFIKAELAGKEKVGGQDAYVIRLTGKDGAPVTRYYDVTTFLLLRADAVDEGPQGKIPVETLYMDYREVDGVKTAFQWTKKTPVGETIIKIVEVKTNAVIDDARFAKPSRAGS
jgi:carboxyl-terminal processing protease